MGAPTYNLRIPDEPHIVTIYDKKGGVTTMPSGYTGTKCREATAPYMLRQGGSDDDQPTVEADLTTVSDPATVVIA